MTIGKPRESTETTAAAQNALEERTAADERPEPHDATERADETAREGKAERDDASPLSEALDDREAWEEEVVAVAAPPVAASAAKPGPAANTALPGNADSPPDGEYLRQCAWEIGERRPADSFAPPENHVAMAMVNPCRGFAHWRISHDWIEATRRRRADAWQDCRMVLRLYDVSYITFTGLNANHIQDQPLPGTCGQLFYQLPHAGTWQLGEVGFALRNGEFIPAARSRTVSFSRVSTSSYGSQDALLVDDKFRSEAVHNLWDQETILRERRTPKLRASLRIVILCMPYDPSGGRATPPEFIMRLASGLGENGHDVHLLAPAGVDCDSRRAPDGVHFHTLSTSGRGTPMEIAAEFGRIARQRIRELAPIDLMHIHEWTAGLAEWGDDLPKVCSLTSLEATRRKDAAPDAQSADIEEAERRVAESADMLLVPGWLREKAVAELRIDDAHVHCFAMEGRPPSEWETPLDYGQVKRGIHFGPLDRLVLFIGPLEHAAGPDLLLEALPVLLHRTPNLRVAFAGGGGAFGGLQHRARQLGVEHAVRFLGHVDRDHVRQLLRASEALVLPSRGRVPFDDAVVDLARRAGLPVVTTHGGPAYLVRHEENGIVTYDNPGSMVWALDRVLSDPDHARRMGENGRRCDDSTVSWGEVARHYLELCSASFPQLTEVRS